MWWDRGRWWTILIPPITAAGLMLLYFAAFDRWSTHELENPIASQLAPLCGVIGFAAGFAATRIRRWEMVLVPLALAVAVGIWAAFTPRDNANDREFRQILILLTALLIVGTVVLNFGQITRGRHAPPEPRADEE